MTPYQTARHLYHAPPQPEVTFDVLISFCLAHGAVISHRHAFILAIPYRMDTPTESLRILSPLQFSGPPDAWHIYLAAGRLDALKELHAIHPLPWLSWFRRDGRRLRVHPAHPLLRRHDQAESPAAAASTPAAGLIHGT